MMGSMGGQWTLNTTFVDGQRLLNIGPWQIDISPIDPRSAALQLLLYNVPMYIYTIMQLAIQRAQQAPYFIQPQDLWPRPTANLRLGIRVSGLIFSILILMVPNGTGGLLDPLQECGLRIVCFFYACKVTDLAFARVDAPPTRLVRGKDGGALEPAPMRTVWDRTKYGWFLATEMRYGSFDIAIHQEKRLAFNTWQQSLAWTIAPCILVPALACAFPFPELKCAALLVLLQLAMEALHLVVHPLCPDRLFYRPFAASTMSDFWSTHWHLCAQPFTRSLAYNPVKRYFTPLLGKEGGRAVAVLAAFSLSGIWHGWASAPLVTRPWLLALQVWLLFIGFGVTCIAERWIWGQKQGGVLQRVIVWVYALCGAGVCFRTLECYSKIDWLRRSGV